MKQTFIKSTLLATALATLFAVAGVASAQEIRERTLKFALTAPDGHPATVGMRKFAESTAAKSGGRIKVQLFLGGTLGSDQAVVSSVKGGTVEMSVMNSGILASEVKALEIFDFPFLFANERESDAIVDGPIGQKMHGLLEEKGIVGLAYWELGFRSITNSRRPINKVEDIEGLKLRVIPNVINVDWVRALGANPTPLPFPELYAALEQKAIDGQENPVSVIASSKFFEVQKHLVLTNHQYNPQSVIFSKKVWDTLSATERKIIDDAADAAVKVQRQASRAAVAANLELLKKNGMNVTQFSPAEVAKLREKMKPVIDKHSAALGSTVAEVQAELAKLRK